MPNVHFSFRRGAGDVPEILYGKVEIKPTLAFARGTSLVLPAPTTLDLVNGEVTANNVYPTPAPVEGQVEWAYRVKAIDTRGQSFEWMVGVPDSTGTVEFTSLPRYFETKPPLFGKGEKGDPGEAATIQIGTTTSGTTPSVTNSGTNQNAVLDFVLPKGDKGDRGDGVPSGGTALQYLRKDAAGAVTEWATLDKASVGLGNVDNTSDANKPISTATGIALDSKYPYLMSVPSGSVSLVVAPGKYYQGSASQVTTENGYPWNGSSGTLDVYPYASTKAEDGSYIYLVQEWFSASDNRKALRSTGNGGSSWRPWEEYTSTKTLSEYTKTSDISNSLSLGGTKWETFSALCYWPARPEGTSQWTQGFSINEDTQEIYVSAYNYGTGAAIPAQWVECRNYDGSLKWRTPDIPVVSTSAYSEGLPYFYNQSNQLCFILRLDVTGTTSEGIISIYNSVTSQIERTLAIKGNSKLFSDGTYFYSARSVPSLSALYGVYKYTLASIIAGTPELVFEYTLQNYGDAIDDEKPQALAVIEGKFVTTGGKRNGTTYGNGRPTIRVYNSDGSVNNTISLDQSDFRRAMSEVFTPELIHPTGVNYENEGVYPLKDGRVAILHHLYENAFITIHGSGGRVTSKTSLTNVSWDTGWLPIAINTSGGISAFDTASTPQYRRIGSQVYLRGAFKGVETIGSSYVLGTIPLGARLSLPNHNFIACSNGTSYWRGRVTNGGNIQIIGYSGTLTSSSWLPVDTSYICGDT